MNPSLKYALALAGFALAGPALAQITFFERGGFEGRSFTNNQATVRNFERVGFNDRSSSVVVSGRDRWEVCEHQNFEGQCRVLMQGRYASLEALGMNNSISSVRRIARNDRIDDDRYAPAPLVVSDYRRRGQERTFQAEVTSVRAVVGPNNQRCWIEREQVAPERRGANVPAALMGAVVGGIIGHQIGGGTGRDIATVGGVVAGAALGSNIGRNEQGQQVASQNVQRCSSVRDQAQPSYWDVSYVFRGRSHRVQLTQPPGDTVTVNRDGEPRA
ncbi:beta/gamma crystallin-related protein [Roseateles microcysteis]|uniref:beta/gamma crystallin-related protein n=1 Tax=Roseateles microcysteis TaxID=3119057 RepID=UPI002FE5CAE7